MSNILLETPQWTVEPKDMYAKAGSDVSIECRARGSPMPLISWFKYAKPSKFVRSGSTLELFNIQQPSSGLYECVADNGVDKPLKKVFRVTINGIKYFLEMQRLTGNSELAFGGLKKIDVP